MNGFTVGDKNQSAANSTDFHRRMQEQIFRKEYPLKDDITRPLRGDKRLDDLPLGIGQI